MSKLICQFLFNIFNPTRVSGHKSWTQNTWGISNIFEKNADVNPIVTGENWQVNMISISFPLSLKYPKIMEFIKKLRTKENNWRYTLRHKMD